MVTRHGLTRADCVPNFTRPVQASLVTSPRLARGPERIARLLVAATDPEAQPSGR